MYIHPRCINWAWPIEIIINCDVAPTVFMPYSVMNCRTTFLQWQVLDYISDSLIRKTKNNKIRQIQTNISCNATLPASTAIDIPKVAIISSMTLYLISWRIVFVLSHCARGAPNHLLFNNIWWNRGELSAKQAKAKIRNGVVGNNGNTAPMIPNTIKNQPRMRGCSKICVNSLN